MLKNYLKEKKKKKLQKSIQKFIYLNSAQLTLLILCFEVLFPVT